MASPRNIAPLLAITPTPFSDVEVVMPAAKPVRPNTVLRITRYTQGRRGRLPAARPDPTVVADPRKTKKSTPCDTRQLVVYLLGFLARLLSFDVLAVAVVPHCLDVVVHDRRGRRGILTQKLHYFLTRTLNTRHDLTGPMWDTSARCDYRELDTLDEIAEHCVQVMTLPERCGLTHDSAALLSTPTHIGNQFRAGRPTDLWVERKLDPLARAREVLPIVAPPELDPQTWAARLDRQLQERRQQIAAEDSAPPRAWHPTLGRQEHAPPTAPEPRSTPRLAKTLRETDKRRKRRLRADNADFHERYHHAWALWRDGHFDLCVFPKGTFWMNQFCTTRCGCSELSPPAYHAWLAELGIEGPPS